MTDTVERALDSAEAFIAQYRPHDLSEGRFQQWEAAKEAIKDARAVLASLAAERAAEDNTSKYDNEMFNEGVTHAVELLAKSIGATGWYAGDGSEDYDCDLAQTFLNILAAKGLYDEDDGRFATLASVKSVPNGWQLVPKEPTEEMIKAGGIGAKVKWSAMLAAAPTLPVQPVSDEPVAAYQWKHTDPIGNIVWLTKQFWNGHRATEQRPLYTRPQPAKEVVEALRGMLAHSCVADAGGDMKTEEDHEAERRARAALASLSQEQG